jgi:hypothetical protein
VAAREQLDSDLGVRQWGTVTAPATVPAVEPDAPAWWYGDSEAADSFLTAMGVTLP